MTGRPLILIPVRGGSVGLPRKAVRRLAGICPLVRTLDTVARLGDVVVVTDDAEIRWLAASKGVRVIDEPTCEEPIGIRTLRQVVWGAVHQLERNGESHEAIAVVQCTSPLLRRTTIERCLAALEGRALAVTVRDDRHLRLGDPQVIRQAMAPCWRVTGGCTAILRSALQERLWPMEEALPVVVEGAEAVDLDTPEDWAIAEMYAGATERETLLARVLAPGPVFGTAVVLSAWDEDGEDVVRFQVAQAFAHCLSLHGDNTHDEAQRALDLVSDQNVTIVTSAYHAPRAFLTFLRVLQDQQEARRIRLWSAPTPSHWTVSSMHAEWAKIAEYQAKGHVASYEEGLAYLDWRDACAIS